MNVIGARATKIDDKVGVLLRERRAADAMTLHPGGFEQSSRKIAGRIFEDRSRIGNAARLTRCAFTAHFHHSRAQLVAIAVTQFEIDPRNHEVRRQIACADMQS